MEGSINEFLKLFFLLEYLACLKQEKKYKYKIEIKKDKKII